MKGTCVGMPNVMPGTSYPSDSDNYYAIYVIRLYIAFLSAYPHHLFILLLGSTFSYDEGVEVWLHKILALLLYCAQIVFTYPGPFI